MPRSPRPPKDYIAEYNRLLASRRVSLIQPTGPNHRLNYYRRMAKKQREAIERNEPFIPQRARGHRAGEHIPRRQSAILRRAEERILRLPMAQYDAARDRLADLAANDPERLKRIESARNWAQRHPKGAKKWAGRGGYQEEFDLEDEDFNLFWPAVDSGKRSRK